MHNVRMSRGEEREERGKAERERETKEKGGKRGRRKE